jgi:pectate lyase
MIEMIVISNSFFENTVKLLLNCGREREGSQEGRRKLTFHSCGTEADVRKLW